MYGRTFRTYEIARVLNDIADSKTHGTEWVIFADDNITLDVARFERLCDAIVAAGHNDVTYIVQASCAGIASSERLVRKMSRANVRVVFLGIENVSKRNLQHLGKGNILEKTRTAIEYLHRHGILIVAGMMVGHPEDTEEDIIRNFDFLIEQQVEFYGDQAAQPYPTTEMRAQLLQAGLVTNPDDYRRYDGFWANVRTKHLTSDQLQFLKWRHHRRAAFNHCITPTLRSAYPLFAAALRWLHRPYRRLAFRLRHWNRTEREIFEVEMQAARKLNDFFGKGQ